jgi:hypothetical protein
VTHFWERAVREAGRPFFVAGPFRWRRGAAIDPAKRFGSSQSLGRSFEKAKKMLGPAAQKP